MIKLYQFPRVYGVPNASPFCMKVECALRMARLDYEIVPLDNPASAPKGKLPYIEDGTVRLADSEHILDYLRDRYGFDPDAGLTSSQRAASRALQVLLDERYYWVNVHLRWIDDRNWPTNRDAFFGAVPGLIRPVIAGWVRRGLRRELYGHGLGRHSPNEIYTFGIEDIKAIAAWLGDGPYFHGDRPTRIDASLTAYLANLFVPRLPFNPLREEGERHPNLLAYCERSLTSWFPEFARPQSD